MSSYFWICIEEEEGASSDAAEARKSEVLSCYKNKTGTKAPILTLSAAPAARIEEHERDMKEMQKKILVLQYKHYILLVLKHKY